MIVNVEESSFSEMDSPSPVNHIERINSLHMPLNHT